MNRVCCRVMTSKSPEFSYFEWCYDKGEQAATVKTLREGLDESEVVIE